MSRMIKASMILRLAAQGHSSREIERAGGGSRRSIQMVLSAAQALGVSWDDVADLDDELILQRLLPHRKAATCSFPQPDWEQLHKELGRVGVTLKLLYGEWADHCRTQGLELMSYSQFTRYYSQWHTLEGVTSRIEHKAGVTCEVDWAGPTLPLVDPVTGEVTRVSLFVGVLPFSRYTFVFPALDKSQENWLEAHVAMFEFFGGVPRRVVPDNCKTAVIARPRNGEVVLNEAYKALASHYCTAVIPARVRKPKDKPSVENSVHHATIGLVGFYRNTVFTSMGQIRQAITDWLGEYNAREFTRRAGSRAEIFDREERAHLLPLPAAAYEVGTWFTGRKVHSDSHIVFEGNFYSVPHRLVGSVLDVRVTSHQVEIWKGSARVATHTRWHTPKSSHRQTIAEHLPAKALHAGAWDKDRVMEWAGRVGPATAQVCAEIFARSLTDDLAIGPAISVLRLRKRHQYDQLEAACVRALATVGAVQKRHVEQILAGTSPAISEPQDEGLRGAAYYQNLN